MVEYILGLIKRMLGVKDNIYSNSLDSKIVNSSNNNTKQNDNNTIKNNQSVYKQSVSKSNDCRIIKGEVNYII